MRASVAGPEDRSKPQGMSACSVSRNSCISTVSGASDPVSPRAKVSVASTMPCISSTEAIRLSRVSSSSTISARTRIAVRGERRSWPSAANIRVRSLTKRVSRSCIRLKAPVRSRTSVGPATGSSATSSPRPKSSAARASRRSGPVSRVITNQMTAPSSSPADTAKVSMEYRGHWIGGRSNRVPTFSH